MTRITLRLGEHEVAGELNDGPTALDLLELLPIELPLTDFHEQEKLVRLPRPLTVSGAPDRSGAGPGDIAYYAPLRTFVLYYAEVDVFAGIVPVGRFDHDAVDILRPLPDGTVLAVTPA